MDRKIYPRIGQPCPKTWDSLDGDAQERFCSECQHHVHNLSEMSAKEVVALMRQPGRKCVAYVVTEDTPVVSGSFWLWWHRFWILRPFTPVLVGVLRMFGAASCKKTASPRTADEIDGGWKTAATVGVVEYDGRPWWKRILGIK